MRRALVGLLLLCAAASSCGKHLYGRDDLDFGLSTHHIDLRWGRLQNAAQRVHPDMRAAFLEDWSTRLADVELQDIEVVGVSEGEDGDTADVVVQLTWVEKRTLALRQASVTERWVRTDQGWRVVRPLELPAQ